MMRRLGAYFASCLLALTAGHMFNYSVILYLQETVGSALLSGIGFGRRSAAHCCSAGLPAWFATGLRRTG